jgi:hypothetical protein
MRNKMKISSLHEISLDSVITEVLRTKINTRQAQNIFLPPCGWSGRTLLGQTPVFGGTAPQYSHRTSPVV